MSNNTDFTKPQFKINELLTEITRSDLNNSLLENTTDRHLSKKDTVHVYGTIGKKINQFPNTNRIKEDNVSRTAYQLQPIVYHKIATKEYITSFFDILNKLKHNGVDVERFPEWGDTDMFNFAPPIDIDKFANYTDYYWYDVTDKSSPEYVTIGNQLTKIRSKIIEKTKYLNNLIAQNGDTDVIRQLEFDIHTLSKQDAIIAGNNFGWDIIDWDNNNINTDIIINNPNIFWQSNVVNNHGFDDDLLLQRNDWNMSNRWVHKSDITDFSHAVRASYPIIEYFSSLELNEWTYTKHKWKYRKNIDSPWMQTENEPSSLELTDGYPLLEIETKTISHVQNTPSDMWLVNCTIKNLVLDNIEVILSGNITNIDKSDDYFILPDYCYNTVSLDNAVKILFDVDAVQQFVEDKLLQLNILPATFDASEYTGIVNIPTTDINVIIEGDIQEVFNVNKQCVVNHTVYNNGVWRVIDSKLNNENGYVVTLLTLHPTPTPEQVVYDNLAGFSNGIGTLFPSTVNSMGDQYVNFFTQWLYDGHEDAVPVNHQVENNNILTHTFTYNGEIEMYVQTPYYVNTSTLYVYVNNVRQYSHVYEVGEPNTLSTIIRFDSNIFNIGDTITVKAGAYAKSDVDLVSVAVRVSQNDPIQSTGIMPVSLVKYRKKEQIKKSLNQYPLFDLYNVYGTTAHEATCIFKYKEDNVNGVYVSDLQQYIIPLTKDYVFEQLLVSNDDKLRAYKDYATMSPTNREGLQLIWKKGDVSRYIPRLVDEYQLGEGDVYLDSTGKQQINTLDGKDTTWELSPQLYNNYNHECRQYINYSQLFTHFTTIIDKQNSNEFNYVSKKYLPKLLDDINYGVGGTIKEHNYSFDTAISALIQEIVTPLTLINFAADQYEQQLEYVKQITLQYIRSNITSDLSIDVVYKEIYNTLSLNDNYEKIYGDSTSRTIKNWIATLPILGFVDRVPPFLYVDEYLGITQLLHHDGHKSDIVFNAQQIDLFLNSLTNNVIRTNGIPTLTNSIVPGTILFDNSNGKIYKYNVTLLSDVYPPVDAYSDGTLYFNTLSNIAYVLTNKQWVPTTDNNILWTNIDIVNIIANVLYKLEQELYNTAMQESRFNLSDLVNENEYELFNEYLYNEYMSYANSHNYNPGYVDYDPTNAFTYNYKGFDGKSFLHKPNNKTQWFARWYDIYEHYFNTQYPNLEPWRLQSFETKPQWWDDEYLTVNGWSTTMWDNIKQGIIPEYVQLTDNVVIPTYDFVCVNTTGSMLDGIPPNGLLPPYYAGSSALQNEVFLRSDTNIMSSENNEIITALYNFGDSSIIERAWKTSIYYRYDVFKVLYKLQPIKFIHTFFDHDYIIFNGLNISRSIEKVYAHSDVIFHGDPLNDGIYQSNGINQWYVNYLRSHNFDINMSNFYDLWKNWSTKMGYLADAMIDTKSLQLSTRYYNILENDYKVSLKKTPSSNSIHIPGFYVSVNTAGSGYYLSGMESSMYENVVLKRPIGDGSDWTFDVTFVKYIGDMYYYDVNYFNVVNIENGIITIDKPCDWYDGIQVSFDNQYYASFDTSKQYFVKKIDDTHFKLSNTIDDIEFGVYVDFNTNIKGHITDQEPVVFELKDVWFDTSDNTIKQYNVGSNTWIPNTGNIIKLPKNIYDISKIKVYLNGNLLTYGEVDLSTGGVPFGDYIIRGNILELVVDLTGMVSFNIVIPTEHTQLHVFELKSTFIAIDGANCAEIWKHYTINKRVVNVISSRQTLISGVQQVINFIDGFEEYLTEQGVLFNNYARSIDFDDAYGRVVSWQLEIEKLIDHIYVGLYGVSNVYTYAQNLLQLYHEVNPFKYNIWIDHSRGMVSNILLGPFTDIQSQPVVYDQYGEHFHTVDNLRIYRQDKQTHIVCPKIDQVTSFESHIGGLHLYFDAYEHVILFNNYTLDNNMIYDSFVGLNTNAIRISMLREAKKTSRPSHSGYYLLDNESLQNIEATVDNISHYYEAYNVDDSATFIDAARSLLDFNKDEQVYFAQLGMINKSKFAFYRGMIKHKGATNAVAAMGNHREAEDVYLDEYWAVKLAEFGENRVKANLLLKTKTTDVTKSGDILYKFTNSNITEYPYINVRNDDIYRWYDIGRYNEFLTDNYQLSVKVKSLTLPGSLSTYQNKNYLMFSESFNYIQIFLYDDTPIIKNNHNSNVVSGLPFYVDNVLHLNVLVDGIKTTNFKIGSDHHSIIINKITPPHDIRINYVPTLLIENTDYTIINNTVVKLSNNISLKWDALHAFSHEYDVTKHNILKLLNNELVISDIFYYDPINGHHHPQVTHNVDFITQYDPASYTNFTLGDFKNNIWGETEKDVIWWDISNVQYIPYNDRSLINKTNEILQTYGQIADWCDINVYQWTKSDLHPVDWEQAALDNTDDIDNDVIHGVPYKKYYYKYRASPLYDWGQWTEFKDAHIVTYPYMRNFDGQQLPIYFNNVLFNNDEFIGEVDNIIPQKSNIGVYINGVKITLDIDYSITYTEETVDTITLFNVNIGDEIRIIVFVVLPTDEDITNTSNDVNSLYNYAIETPFTEIVTYDVTGSVPTSTYYFWTTKRKYKTNDKLSTTEITNLIMANTDPYYFADNQIVVNGKVVCNELFLRNMKYKITDDVNYQLLLPINFTAHERLDDHISLQKNRHTKWLLFREKQIEKIPKILWNKVVETISGVSLVDGSVIPSLQYIVYDNLNNENTKIGFDVHQCLGEQSEITQIFSNDLYDPNTDYSPINKEVFMNMFNFSTNTSIIDAMEYLYQYGKSEDINRIFFKILHHAYANTKNLHGIIKTSMVALYNLQYFETPDRVIHE